MFSEGDRVRVVPRNPSDVTFDALDGFVGTVLGVRTNMNSNDKSVIVVFDGRRGARYPFPEDELVIDESAVDLLGKLADA